MATQAAFNAWHPAPSKQNYQKGTAPVEEMRCLRITVKNRELPRYLTWMKRESAHDCLGTIRFLYLDGAAYFKEAMPARWAGSPEATPLRRVAANAPIIIWDPVRLSVISKMNIPPGEQEHLDVAVRCDDDAEAYGFNNESYRFAWKNENWTLPKGRYLVEITVRSAGEKIAKKFLLNNDLAPNQFRIEEMPEA
jgi:hypothetical protein